MKVYKLDAACFLGDRLFPAGSLIEVEDDEKPGVNWILVPSKSSELTESKLKPSPKTK